MGRGKGVALCGSQKDSFMRIVWCIVLWDKHKACYRGRAPGGAPWSGRRAARTGSAWRAGSRGCALSERSGARRLRATALRAETDWYRGAVFRYVYRSSVYCPRERGRVLRSTLTCPKEPQPCAACPPCTTRYALACAKYCKPTGIALSSLRVHVFLSVLSRPGRDLTLACASDYALESN